MAPRRIGPLALIWYCRTDWPLSQTVPPANRKLLTYHDSWAYWARLYGYTVVGAAQPSDFKEPSAKEVADLINQVRDEGVHEVGAKADECSGPWPS